MSHEPLSRSLERLAAGADVRTLNDLVVRTEGRGIFLVIILLCLPFATPVPLPGLSNVIGLVLVVVAVRLFLRRPSRLPNFLGAREWPAPRMAKVIRGSTRLLRALERFVKPRHTAWIAQPWAIRLNASVLCFFALLLALPIPPVIPLSNSLPAYAIILLSASMMEEDGATIWFAYAAGALTVIYFGLFTGAIIRFINVYGERIVAFFRDLL
jgi:hypothetical protein